MFFLAAATVALVLWARPSHGPSNVLFVGGPVVTMAEPPLAEALWIEDGRIRAVGGDEVVEAARTAGAQTVDLGGATLMPGLIEPHTHPLATAMLGSAIDVSGFTHATPEEVRAALEEGVAAFSPQPWLIAFGWDPVMMPDLEPPTLAELDALSPDKPLAVLTQMMHQAYVNTAALRAAGITRDTPDPPGASFGRDADGEPNGVIHEVAALDKILEALPQAPSAVSSLLLRWQYGAYADAGYTTIGVLGPVGRAEDPIGLMRALGEDPNVPIRTVIYGLPQQLDDKSAPADPVDANVIVRGVKFWMDGSPYTGGAAFEEPYEDTTFVRERLHILPGHLAPLNYEPEAFTEAFTRFHVAGYQVAVHAQGERAVELALDTVDTVLAKHPRPNHGHRLEHNALIREDQIVRAHELGVELSFFVDHIYYYGHQLPQMIGERTERYMPVGTAFQRGAAPTIHSDNPATPVGPFRAMRTAINRMPRVGEQPLGPDQAITRQQALEAMTIHAARQLGVDRDRGSLEVGKAGDLVVLSRNPLDTPAAQFPDIEVVGTFVGGQPVDTRSASLPNLRIGVDAVGQLLNR